MSRVLFQVLRHWTRLELGLACLFLAVIVGLIAAQIVARTALASPLTWAEEAATLLFIWLVFLGAAAAAKLDRHVQVLAFERVAGPAGMAILGFLGRLLMVAAMLWIASLIRPFIPIEARSQSVALPVRVPKSLYFSVPLIACCLSMAAGAVLLLLRDLARGSLAPDPALAEAILGRDDDAHSGGDA